jgi:DNA-binding response OmpR family regulator
VNILVVDDDPVARALLEALLKPQGHTVALAADGKEAWEATRLFRYPVVIADWMMPELDGLELVRRLRAAGDDRYTYVVLVSAQGGRGRYLEGMAAGADDFLTKPIDADELRARLHVAERILGLRREVLDLRGILPTCSYCKRIRDDGERWVPIERYIEKRSQAAFSHGICPDCYAKHVEPQISPGGA